MERIWWLMVGRYVFFGDLNTDFLYRYSRCFMGLMTLFLTESGIADSGIVDSASSRDEDICWRLWNDGMRKVRHF